MKLKHYCTLVAFGTLLVGYATATPITYELSGTLTGAYGSPTPVLLTGNAFRLTLTGDTADVFGVRATSNSISIAGVGTGTFTGDIHFACTFSGVTGTFSRVPFVIVEFAGLEGCSPLNPIAPTPVVQVDASNWVASATSFGVLQITGITNATFTANYIPEPTSILLLSFGLSIILVLKLRGQRST